MPIFDISTSIIVLIVGHAVSILLLSFDLFRNETTKYDYVFLSGRILQMIGWSLIVARELLPVWISYSAGNSIIYLGWTFEAVAMISLRYIISRRCLEVFGILFLLSLPLIWPVVKLNMGLTTFLLTGIGVFMFIIPGGVLLLIRYTSSPLQKVIGWMYWVCGAALLWRGFDVWINGNTNIFVARASHMAALLSLLSLMLIGGMGYVLIKKEKISREMKAVADTDHLTGLYNRRAFLLLAEKCKSMAARKNASIAVLMIDIDRFKAINDRYGHGVGDGVIANLADVLRAQMRDSDIACRYGGEEFVLLLPDCDSAGALQIAERLRQTIAKVNPESIIYTVSIGVSAAYGNQTKLADLITRADLAMYKAKEMGRNCVQSN
jgi:diguanylate cyclase (GGDEF)-like protein